MSHKTQPQNVSRLRVHSQGVALNIANGAPVAMALTQEDFDSLNEWNIATSQFIPINAGYYFMCFQLVVNAVPINTTLQINIAENAGATYALDTKFHPVAGNNVSMRVSTIQYLTPNNVIIVEGGQNSGGALACANTRAESFFTAHRLS